MGTGRLILVLVLQSSSQPLEWALGDLSLALSLYFSRAANLQSRYRETCPCTGRFFSYILIEQPASLAESLTCAFIDQAAITVLEWILVLV